MAPFEIDRERMTESLCGAEAYPHVANDIEHIETHISDVFLAGEFAYKIKKPVDFGFCDFSTPELRRLNTERELELNQRLTEGVYLSIEPVRFDRESDTYRIGGTDDDGAIVEVALRMKRLNSDDRLDQSLADGRAGLPEIELLAKTLAKFHSEAPVASEDLAQHGNVWNTVIGNLERVREHGSQILDIAALADIEGFSRAFLSHKKSLFEHRRQSGAPKVCHGDLHAGNVFIESHPGSKPDLQIIDCIEFNDELMCIDPAADIAFLSMDLKRRGLSDLATAFVKAYVDESGDKEIGPLLPFYESYRAMVRCLTAAISAEQAEAGAKASHIEQARAYLELACEIASETRPLTLIITAGITGSGKSTVASMLASQWNAVHLQTDVIRKEIAGLGPMERTGEGAQQGIYSAEMSKRTYAEMRRRAAEALAANRSVIMDGVHIKRNHRAESISVAKDSGALSVIIECSLNERESLRRLRARYESGMSESEGRPEVYKSQRPEWEAVSGTEADCVARIDSGEDAPEVARTLFSQLWSAELSK